MILLTGAAGMLGSYFPDEGILKTDKDTLDVRNLASVRKFVAERMPDQVFHLAAETDVDLCEIEVDHAFQTNTLGTYNAALVCQEFDLPLLYVSTAGVFDGEKHEPYTEFDVPNPVNVYGQSKLEGERIVQRLLRRYYIVRAGWMMGGGPLRDKKFVGKMVRLMQERDEIAAVGDKIGSPTYARDLAASLLRLARTGLYGLYHMTNRGVCSRYDVAVEIARLMSQRVHVRQVSSANFPLPAPRARSEAMRNYMLELMGLDWMPTWQEALVAYLEEWKAEPIAPTHERPPV